MQYPFRKEEGRNHPWWSPNSHGPYVLLERRRRGSLTKAWVSWATFLLPLASVLSEDHPCPFLSWPHLRKTWGRSPLLGCSSPFVGRPHVWWNKLSQVLDGEAGGFSSKTIPLSTEEIIYLFVVVQSLSPVRLFVTHGLQHARFPCLSPSPVVCSNSCLLSWCCHPTISSSVIPFSSCLHSFPASVTFPVSWLFASDGQNIGASASASVFPMNIQGWFTLGLIGLISLQFKRFSRTFSNSTVQKHEFFSAQLSL